MHLFEPPLCLLKLPSL